jgi:hypothetical protein
LLQDVAKKVTAVIKASSAKVFRNFIDYFFLCLARLMPH